MAPATFPASVRGTRSLVSLVAVAAIVALAGIGAASAQAASATWSAAVPLAPGQGETVGAVTAPDGTITTVVESYVTGIMAVSSLDGGATWQAPVALGSGGDAAFRATIGVTSSGLLAVAWVEETAGVRAIQIVVSADGGSTWSPPTALPTVASYVDDPAIGSSSALGFTVVWREDTFDKRASSTIDGGTSWSASTVISESMNSYGTADLVAVGAGEIVVFYQEFNGLAGEYSVQSRRSVDGGLTWSPAVFVAPAWSGSLGNSIHTTIVSPAPGSLVAFWTRGLTFDTGALFAATSIDSGATWSAAVQVSGESTYLREFAPAVTSATTAGVTWHEADASSMKAMYAEVTLGAASASIPVRIDPGSQSYYDRLPTLIAIGATRVATWHVEATDAEASSYRSAVSCDGGATWRATTTIVAGPDVEGGNAVTALSGTAITVFWTEYDADLDAGLPFASSIDDPCSVPVADVGGNELAATGASELTMAALVAALGMLAAGILAVRARRPATQG